MIRKGKEGKEENKRQGNKEEEEHEWEMKEKPEKFLAFKVGLDQTFDQLLEEVKTNEGIVENLWFFNKPKTVDGKPTPVKPTKAITSTCITLCELFALDQAERGKALR